MPATSEKQKKFMNAAAHNPAFAKKAGVPVKVAKEYSKASKGQTFNEGGAMKSDIKQDKAMAKKAVGMHESQLHGGKKSNLMKLKNGGSASSRADGCVSKGKTKGMMIKMKSGGKTC